MGYTMRAVRVNLDADDSRYPLEFLLQTGATTLKWTSRQHSPVPMLEADNLTLTVRQPCGAFLTTTHVHAEPVCRYGITRLQNGWSMHVVTDAHKTWQRMARLVGMLAERDQESDQESDQERDQESDQEGDRERDQESDQQSDQESDQEQNQEDALLQSIILASTQPY